MEDLSWKAIFCLGFTVLLLLVLAVVIAEC